MKLQNLKSHCFHMGWSSFLKLQSCFKKYNYATPNSHKQQNILKCIFFSYRPRRYSRSVRITTITTTSTLRLLALLLLLLRLLPLLLLRLLLSLLLRLLLPLLLLLRLLRLLRSGLLLRSGSLSLIAPVASFRDAQRVLPGRLYN